MQRNKGEALFTEMKKVGKSYFYKEEDEPGRPSGTAGAHQPTLILVKNGYVGDDIVFEMGSKVRNMCIVRKASELAKPKFKRMYVFQKRRVRTSVDCRPGDQ
ncbi:hypothetical protein [Streptomyces sp. NBC_00094]|uniref:hypothetical protein n=1 Tax=Streptomyces sp. NBC_00094 TaxID=2903620 RepID=UPI00225AA9A1|nr:hypothetical protein [Streptomyces sp. NBC_00094]MCX5395381.1 hypothetical protein [Streptomyces sp. NBC_00094]